MVEDNLRNEYKEYLLTNSKFASNLKILPTTPQHFVSFPTIIFRERNNSDYMGGKALNNMEYVDDLLYQVDIYSKDIVLDDKKYVARDVLAELRELTSNFFRQVGFIRNSDIPNDVMSAEIKRRTMTFEAQLTSWNKQIF